MVVWKIQGKEGAMWLSPCSLSTVLVTCGDQQHGEEWPTAELKVSQKSGYTKDLTQKQL